MKTYEVYGEKNGEIKLVYRSITMQAFTARGEKNARSHGYKNFTLKEQWTIAGNGKLETIKIA